MSKENDVTTFIFKQYKHLQKGNLENCERAKILHTKIELYTYNQRVIKISIIFYVKYL